MGGHGTKMQKPLIRRAAVEDAGRLTDIAFSAKASWGYSASFMALCRAELTITPDMLATGRFWVALQGGVIGGMIALTTRPLYNRAQIDYSFVAPSFQKQGMGTALFTTICQTCHAERITHLDVTAGPFAEKIYARFGFSKVGYEASHSIPDRFLPRMELRLLNQP